MTLDRIPASSRIFIDSTIFIYHFTGASAQCRELLERCEAGEVKGATSVAVIAEVAHRLMLIEAVKAGHVTAKDALKKLRDRPDVVRKLHIYQEQVERIPLMGVDVMPLEFGAMIASAAIRRRYGLLVNDSLVVAAARGAEVDGLASADSDCRTVKDVKLFQPGDLDLQ